MEKILQGFLSGDHPTPSAKKQANNQLLSRLTCTHKTGYYEVHTWLDKFGGLKVEVSNYHGRSDHAVLYEGTIEGSLGNA